MRGREGEREMYITSASRYVPVFIHWSPHPELGSAKARGARGSLQAHNLKSHCPSILTTRSHLQ